MQKSGRYSTKDDKVTGHHITLTPKTNKKFNKIPKGYRSKFADTSISKSAKDFRVYEKHLGISDKNDTAQDEQKHKDAVILYEKKADLEDMEEQHNDHPGKLKCCDELYDAKIEYNRLEKEMIKQNNKSDTKSQSTENRQAISGMIASVIMIPLCMIIIFSMIKLNIGEILLDITSLQPLEFQITGIMLIVSCTGSICYAIWLFERIGTFSKISAASAKST